MQSMDPSAVVMPPDIGQPFRLMPFRGITLRAQQVGDPAAVGALARAYRERSDRLTQWEASGRSTHDPQPALYVQEYASGGLVVRGLVGALDLSRRADAAHARAVLAHEGVHQPQVRHLARRMLRTGLNPAPILLVQRGPAKVRDLIERVTSQAPGTVFDDARQGHHRIWRISAPRLIADLDRELAEQSPIIADGHHRYAAAVRLQHRSPGSAWDRSLAMLVDQDTTPLFLGAIHRVFAGVRLTDLESAAERVSDFSVERVPRSVAVGRLDPETAVVADGRQWAALVWRPRPGAVLVEALHHTLLPLLPRPARAVSFHHSVDDALARAHGRGRGHLAVLLPALSFDQVHDVVASGRLLPEKATSFQPKPPLGGLMRSVHDE